MGQNLAGITGKKDTSFTNQSALASAAKDFPKAKLAKARNSKSVNERLDITYCIIDGYELKIDIFSPEKKGKKPAAALLLIHGGGWRSGDKSQHHEMAIELASKGYVVLTPAYRLSTFALFPAAVLDVKTSLQWLNANAEKYHIDKSKIALAGYSAGGQMAAFIAATQNNEKYESGSCQLEENTEVNAVIDIDGILAFIHPESGEGDDSKSISAATHYFGYNKFQNPELWNEGSALSHVDASFPPILFLNSSNARMHAGRDEFIGKLNTYGINSEVHTFENAPHVFPLIDIWFTSTIDLIDRFLRKQLK